MGNAANGLANNGMTDAQRAALSSDDPEYQLRWVFPVCHTRSERGAPRPKDPFLTNLHRVTGSQIQVAGWTTYSTLISVLKLAMLVFYVRLTVWLLPTP